MAVIALDRDLLNLHEKLTRVPPDDLRNQNVTDTRTQSSVPKSRAMHFEYQVQWFLRRKGALPAARAFLTKTSAVAEMMFPVRFKKALLMCVTHTPEYGARFGANALVLTVEAACELGGRIKNMNSVFGREVLKHTLRSRSPRSGIEVVTTTTKTRKVHDFTPPLRHHAEMKTTATKSQLVGSLAFDVAALAVGAALWFYQFGMGFVDSPWAWPLVLLQVVGAFALGSVSARWLKTESRAHAIVRLVAYEIGHIYMWVWAAANYSASGKIEFGIGFFLLPIFADVVVWWFGIKKRF